MIAVLCDFDDTAAQQNVAQLLLERFCPLDIQSYRERFRSGEITLKQYQEELFAAVRQSRDTLMGHARENARLREGFVEMARYCRQHAIPLAIVTCGLDFYVQGLLERYGLEDLPYYAVETNFVNGNQIGYTYRHTWPDCVKWGNCKCRVVEEYRSRGYQVFYIGDGISDSCPAARADFVFARHKLLALCQERGIPHIELRDFHVVIEELERRRHTIAMPAAADPREQARD